MGRFGLVLDLSEVVEEPVLAEGEEAEGEEALGLLAPALRGSARVLLSPVAPLMMGLVATVAKKDRSAWLPTSSASSIIGV